MILFVSVEHLSRNRIEALEDKALVESVTRLEVD
jgi:hypothetical protein